ncbi:MAG: hypothetical protein ACRCYS_11775, partial [Beijerinckiaceae bacterium]
DPSKQPPAQPPDPTQDPAFQLQMREQERADAELQMKGQELELKRGELAIKDRDSKAVHLKSLVEMQRGDDATHREEQRRREDAQGESGMLVQVLDQINALTQQVQQLAEAVNGQA